MFEIRLFIYNNGFCMCHKTNADLKYDKKMFISNIFLKIIFAIVLGFFFKHLQNNIIDALKDNFHLKILICLD